MTRILINLLIPIMLPLWSVAGEPGSRMTVLAVQSLRVEPYDQALEGFESVFPGKIHRIFPDEKSKNNLHDEIRKKNPGLILAIGLSALTRVMAVTDIPVLYPMVLDPPPEVLKASNIAGISMSAAPDVQLDILRKTMPHVRTIELIYDPSKSEFFVKIAREAATRKNFLLLASPVKNSREEAGLFKSMKDRMDLFWMIPDPRLLTGENIELFRILSMENRIPILSFSERFTESGSLMSISMNPLDLGVQGGRLAEKILMRQDIGAPCVCAEKPVVTVNSKILENLDIPFDFKGVKDIVIMK